VVENLSETRQLVLADMAFNLGVGPSEEDKDGKLLTFKNTLRAMQEGRYEDAAKGMEDSPWYRQVGRRAVKLVDMMRKG
jgi:lysozyme